MDKVWNKLIEPSGLTLEEVDIEDMAADIVSEAKRYNTKVLET
jgi:hypothetical protein